MIHNILSANTLTHNRQAKFAHLSDHNHLMVNTLPTTPTYHYIRKPSTNPPHQRTTRTYNHNRMLSTQPKPQTSYTYITKITYINIVYCSVFCSVFCSVAEELGISSATTSPNTTKRPFPALVAHESAISSATTHLPLS